MMTILAWWGYVLITAVLVAVGNIIRKHLLNHEHALEQMAAESPFRLLGVLFLIPFVKLPTLTESLFILVAATLLFFTALYKNKSYRHLPISTVAPLMNLSPVFLLVIAAVLLGERITLIQFCGILLVMAGGYFLDLKNKNPLGPILHAAKSPYTSIVVFTLIMMSFMGTIDKYILSTLSVDSISYLFWLYLVYTCIAFTVHVKQYGIAPLTQDIKKGHIWLALAGLLTVLEIGILYYALSIPGVLISLVVPLRRTATLLETAVGGAIFHEKHLLQRTIASIIMIGGVVLII